MKIEGSNISELNEFPCETNFFYYQKKEQIFICHRVRLIIFKYAKTIVIRNGKIVRKHGPYLLIFSLEPEISGVDVQSIHQNSEKWQVLLGTAH